MLLSLLVCALPLHASKDRPCRSGEFQITVEPEKHTFAKGERVTVRISFTNLASRDVYVIPYQFPFNYWLDKHSDGRWKSLPTGVVGPNAKKRGGSSLATTQNSEYRRVPPGETFTTHFEVELSSITKSIPGTYRLNAVRIHVYETDSAAKNSGCALFAARSAPFTVL